MRGMSIGSISKLNLKINVNTKGVKMPVHAVRSAGGKIIGWQFGQSGKIYKTKAEAEAQERAIRASGWSGDVQDNCSE